MKANMITKAVVAAGMVAALGFAGVASAEDVAPIVGNVYNQGYTPIKTTDAGFQQEIAPGQQGVDFSVTDSFKRITYTTDEGYGCVVELSNSVPQVVNAYPVHSSRTQCQVVRAGNWGHFTVLISPSRDT